MQSSNAIKYDSLGLIVHTDLRTGDPDGGDTAQREGWYWTGVWIRNALGDPWPDSRKLSLEEVLDLLEPGKDGVFYRHPTLPPWNNPFSPEFGFSRDQMLPLVTAMGLWGDVDRLRRLWNALPQDAIGGTRHSFNGEWHDVFGLRHAYYTGDIIGPTAINTFRRSWQEDPSQAGDGNGPIGERELAANVALRIPPRLTDRDDTGDDLNLIIMLLMSAFRFPFAGSQAPIIPSTQDQLSAYAKNRLASYGSFSDAYAQDYGDDLLAIPITPDVKRRLDLGIDSGWQTDCSRVYGALRWYHRSGTGANPGLAELYRPIVKAFLE